MDQFETLRIYDDDPVHDMEVDYDCHINTGELDDLFPEEDDDFIDCDS